MQILKRAKSGGDIIPWSASESSLKDEVNHRTNKAGYTDRDGQPRGAGKGDSPRPVNKKLYDQNYERIFGHK